MEITKLSDTQIEVTTEIITPPQTVTKTYDREFIENQIISITAQRDEMIALKEAELKVCTDILAEMDKQNIITVAEFAANNVIEETISE